jgi:hypothetical protein
MKPTIACIITFICCLCMVSIPNILISQPNKYPVIVVGGGAGGTSAAIQIARQGIPVLIIEETNWLGGTLTASGVTAIDGSDNICGGLWYEFREALYKHYNTKNLATGWASNTLYEPSVGDRILKTMVAQEPKIKVLYNSTLYKAQKNKNTIISVDIKDSVGKIIHFQADIFIDATETGDLMNKAKDDFFVGMDDPKITKESMAIERNNIIQDLTWVAILKDYRKPATIAKPKDYDPSLYYCSCKDATCVGEGYPVDKIKMLNYGKLPNGSYMLNWSANGNDYYANDLIVSESKREKIYEKAKLKTLGFIYFMQTELQLSTISIDSNAFDTKDKLALIPYRRESRRIQGQQMLTVNHILDPYNFIFYKYGIAVGDYPINHHHKQMPTAPNIVFPKIPAYNIPLGALQSKKISNLLVCDKNISVSNIVNGTTHLQPVCMGTGQAAGALAVAILSATSHSGKGGILRHVQNQLLRSKAFIFPTHDIDINHKYFSLIQKTLINGIIEGIPVAGEWANKIYFNQDSSLTYASLERGLNRIIPTLVIKNSTDKSLVTLKLLAQLLNEAGKTMYKDLWKHKSEAQIIEDANKMLDIQYQQLDTTLTRLQIAILIDGYLRPFDFTVND